MDRLHQKEQKEFQNNSVGGAITTSNALQEKANNSNQVIQHKVLQEKANNSDLVKEKSISQSKTNNPSLSNSSQEVIQAKLTPGALNLVGETHYDDDKRKKKEKEYSKNKIKGGFWFENEFRVGKEPKGFFAKDNREYADALELRILQCFEFMLKYLTQYDQKKEDEEAEYDSFIYYRKQAKKHINKAVYKIEPHSMDDELISLLKELQKEEFALGTTDENEKMITKEFSKLAQAIKKNKPIQQLSSTTNNTFDKVSQTRSNQMHEKAEKEGADGKVGIWKIGDDHVNDISKYTSSPTNYHLTPEDEFNREMKKYLEEKKEENKWYKHI